jgi:hypothetical protein
MMKILFALVDGASYITLGLSPIVTNTFAGVATLVALATPGGAVVAAAAGGFAVVFAAADGDFSVTGAWA